MTRRKKQISKLEKISKIKKECEKDNKIYIEINYPCMENLETYYPLRLYSAITF